eukprot:scaffold142201_cov57-Phaeocystis_antarctica.AAC.1
MALLTMDLLTMALLTMALLTMAPLTMAILTMVGAACLPPRRTAPAATTTPGNKQLQLQLAATCCAACGHAATSTATAAPRATSSATRARLAALPSTAHTCTTHDAPASSSPSSPPPPPPPPPPSPPPTAAWLGLGLVVRSKRCTTALPHPQPSPNQDLRPPAGPRDPGWLRAA